MNFSSKAKPFVFAVILVAVVALFAVICSGSSSGSSSRGSGSYSSFSNKYGTSTTKCHHPGCNNYIASSGDTNCCTKHSNRCLQCGCYIDEDAMYCMDCIRKSLGN